MIFIRFMPYVVHISREQEAICYLAFTDLTITVTIETVVNKVGVIKNVRA